VVTSNDKPKDGKEEPRPAAAGRTRQAARQSPRPVEPRPRRYMVAALPQQSLAMRGVTAPAMDAAGLLRLLEDDPQVRVRRRLRDTGGAGTLCTGGAPFPPIVVADMTPEHALTLRLRHPQLHIERDRLLALAEAAPRRRRASAAVLPPGPELTVTFLVKGAGGRPVPGAVVYVIGAAWTAQAVTGPDGRATVTMTGETPESVTGVVVKPRAGHWSAYLDRPSLATDRDNLVELTPLADAIPGFPGTQVFGWGQRAMNLDRLPPTLRGAGVKIAIIDSGADTGHPDLAGRVRAGLDLTGDRPDGWTADGAGHGSHCAGIIAGADDGRGIVGFAVEAEVHVCKIFPGGRFSDLIEALDHAIGEGIDVVSLGLACRHPSQLVAAKIDQARNAGVACVVAAGSDGGPVWFPGVLPTVLTVTAIGKTGEFPPGTAHAAELREPRTADGYFSPKFACHGPEVDVCAPGVAILSSVPPDGYAVMDGASAAAPHVAGLAALVLAHHPDFHGAFAARDARRVDRLFQIIKASCTPIDLGDARRTGAGLPDALRALAPALALIAPDPGEVTTLLEQLTTEMVTAGLLPPAAGQGTPGAAPAAGPAAQPPGRYGHAGAGAVNGAAAQAGGPESSSGPAPRGAAAGAPPGSAGPVPDGLSALCWLAEEMQAAGLPVEPVSDLLD